MVDAKPVTNVLDLLKESSNLGLFIFEDLALAAAKIAGLGGFIKAFVAFLPSKPDPIKAELKALRDQIDMLASKMTAHFNSMEAFIVKINFQTEVMVPTSRLTKFMLDCMSSPVKEAEDNFIQEYKKNSPLSIAYTLLSLMENRDTNPLVQAMSADRLKRTVTFENWDTTIRGILGQFLFLEAYATGLVYDDESTHNMDMLVKRSEDFLETVQKWKKQYKSSEDYWPGLKLHLKEFMEQTKPLNNTQKADKLKEDLDSIMTDDSLILVVSDTSDINSYGVYTPRPEQVISVFNRGNSSVLIYRSRVGKHLLPQGYETMRDNAAKLNEDAFFHVSFFDLPKTAFDKFFNDSGLVMFAPLSLTPHIRVCNWTRFDEGPGAFGTLKVSYRLEKCYKVIVGCI